MRADPRSRAAIDRLRDLCTEATPGAYRLVAEATSRPAEDLERIARRFFRAFETNDRDDLEAILAPDVRVHLPGEDHPLGRAEFLEVVAGWSRAFSGLSIMIEQQIAEGDSVASRVTVRGTHDLADFAGIRPVGARFEVGIHTIERVRDGRIAERWVAFDVMALLRQLEHGAAGGGAAGP